MANFVCDLMRYYYEADCCIMAAGTIRGDQIYPPGILRLKDIINCFPFEDPVIVLQVTGKAIWDALENGASKYPALEGTRPFPQITSLRNPN
jgi:2',3'-cyclic-nucleotide 2'-phosphodiesterase (5'-nucleotidase family)